MNIVISADDFGRSLERNIAIDRAFKSGMIKSAGLILSPKYAEDAVRLATEGGYISDIHPHFCLASGNQLSGGMKPLSKRMINCSKFCKDGEFTSVLYLKADFLRYVDIFYSELECQYLKFKELTDNRGNSLHADFHLYGNLSFPVALAFRKFIKIYKIQSVRYIGIHHLKNPESIKTFIARALIARALNGKKGEIAQSCNIDYFLTKRSELGPIKNIELYCHPDMLKNEIFDNTESVFGHEKRYLKNNYNDLLSVINEEDRIFSWRELMNQEFSKLRKG